MRLFSLIAALIVIGGLGYIAADAWMAGYYLPAFGAGLLLALALYGSAKNGIDNPGTEFVGMLFVAAAVITALNQIAPDWWK